MELIRTEELAKRIGRVPETIVRWRRQRKGPPYLRIHGRVLYDWEVVAAQWLAPLSIPAALPHPKRGRPQKHSLQSQA